MYAPIRGFGAIYATPPWIPLRFIGVYHRTDPRNKSGRFLSSFTNTGNNSSLTKMHRCRLSYTGGTSGIPPFLNTHRHESEAAFVPREEGHVHLLLPANWSVSDSLSRLSPSPDRGAFAWLIVLLLRSSRVGRPEGPSTFFGFTSRKRWRQWR